MGTTLFLLISPSNLAEYECEKTEVLSKCTSYVNVIVSLILMVLQSVRFLPLCIWHDWSAVY